MTAYVQEKPSIAAYLGPDTLLPLGSALAGLLGMGLLFGHRVASLARKAVRKLTGKPAEEHQEESNEETSNPSGNAT